MALNGTVYYKNSSTGCTTHKIIRGTCTLIDTINWTVNAPPIPACEGERDVKCQARQLCVVAGGATDVLVR